MDRSWREIDHDIDLENKTFRERLSSGAYTYQAISTRLLKRFQLNQRKVGFLEEVLNNSESYSDDEKLVVKKVHMQVLKHYNQYRWTFMLLATMVCVTTATNAKRAMALRLLPTLMIGPLVSLYHHNIGNLGVHRNIDELFKVLTKD